MGIPNPTLILPTTLTQILTLLTLTVTLKRQKTLVHSTMRTARPQTAVRSTLLRCHLILRGSLWQR